MQWSRDKLLHVSAKSVNLTQHAQFMQSDCLVVLGFNATLTAKVISWRSVTHVFFGFLTPVLTQLFLRKPPTTFITCFFRDERRKHAGKKVRLNRGSNSQPPGHESDTLTTEPPGRGFMQSELSRNGMLAFSKFSLCLSRLYLGG